MSLEELKSQILQALKHVNKIKGATTRALVKYLVDYHGHTKSAQLAKTVRKVLNKVVRRGEVQRNGFRYKLVRSPNKPSRRRSPRRRSTRTSRRQSMMARRGIRSRRRNTQRHRSAPKRAGNSRPLNPPPPPQSGTTSGTESEPEPKNQTPAQAGATRN